MRSQITPRSVRRLLAADGYMDLNMPDRAIAELEKVQHAGVLEGPRQLMLGIALKQRGDLDEAIPHLEFAARNMPKPVRRFAWQELTECYRAVDSFELAELAESLGVSRSLSCGLVCPSDRSVCSPQQASLTRCFE